MSIDTKLDQQMADELRAALMATLQVVLQGQPAYLAIQVADAVLSTFIEQLAGSRVYVPAGREIDAAAVRAAFTGNNRDEVCARFGISRATLYRMTKAKTPLGTADSANPIPQPQLQAGNAEAQATTRRDENPK